MDKKTIVYYSQLYFLDSALETINCIKYDINIHLVVEISPDSLNSTVFDVVKSNLQPGFNAIEKIISEQAYENLQSSFLGLKSLIIYFIDSPKSISIKSLLHSSDLSAYIKALNPDYIHFDSSSFRFVFAFPWLFSYKIVLTIHDPVPHSGEYAWKRVISDFLYLKIASNIVFYSSHAKKLFQSKYLGLYKPIHVLNLLPYQYISTNKITEKKSEDYILFFGRLSLYKGIDILLEAIPKVLNKFPDQKIIIAGKPEIGFDCNFRKTPSVIYILRYLQVEELRNLILKSKFIVCPYRDATQSGVLMTCFALNKSVVATNVGAFPEYISDGYNGLLSAPDADQFANAMIYALTDNLYEHFNKNLQNSSFEQGYLFNNSKLKEIYEISNP